MMRPVNQTGEGSTSMGERQAQLIPESELIGKGSEVKVRRPRAGESGVWKVTGPVASPEPEADPAWDVTNVVTGRRRIFRSSRLILLRQARRSGA
jgi:hypothetical protein